jgi:hypothetical protein
MLGKRRTLLLALSGIALCSLVVGAFFAFQGGSRAASASQGTTTHLKFVGTVNLSALGAGNGTSTGGLQDEVAPSPDVDQQIPHSSRVVHVSASNVPRPAGNSVVTDATSPGFAGLNHFDSRTAGSGSYAGTQFSLEPPDQGLCVGNGYVIEAVNDVVRMFHTNGTAASPAIAINQFFLLKPAIHRGPPPVFGDFVSDPKCYYDVDTGRFFMTVLQISVDPTTGAFVAPTHTEIAVSQTNDPTAAWSLLSLDTTDASHANCPCLGDQPLIGADAYGFYVSTNEFGLNSGFNGAQIYAMSKTALEAATSGSAISVFQINAGAIAAPDGGIWYTLQPATSPNAGYDTNNGGTEYFLSALDFSGTLDNRVATWALTNTSSLNSTPDLTLSKTLVDSEVYGQPPNAIQRNGSIPLADAVKSPIALLAGNDDRMNQVVYADGKLWSGVNSVVQTPNGPTRVGIAYFVVSPSDSNGTLSASMASQGYVSVNQENTLFPSIGVNDAGQGVMTFTVVGPDYYPSAAYFKLGSSDTAVHIAGAGKGPEDGFTGYRAYGGGGVSRWGDYSAAVAATDGSIWMATEYIGQTCSDAQFAADTTCGGTRTILANWGTFISNVNP